jgi:hypothetical protein
VSVRSLSRRDIELLFHKLNAQLHMVGGAVMCLVHAAREATQDVDGWFRPASELRTAASRVALEAGLAEGWLNDAVKGFLSPQGTFNVYVQLSHLVVHAADPAYMLAMKCLAARIGEEFHDIDDIRFLLRCLNLTSVTQAREVIGRYYPLERFPQKTLYLLEDLLPS